MKENEKREFAKKLEQTAQALKESVDTGMGRVYILIGSDRIEGDDKDGGGNTQTIIAAGGNTGQIIEALADFIAQDDTAVLLGTALKLAALKKVAGE